MGNGASSESVPNTVNVKPQEQSTQPSQSATRSSASTPRKGNFKEVQIKPAGSTTPKHTYKKGQPQPAASQPQRNGGPATTVAGQNKKTAQPRQKSEAPSTKNTAANNTQSGSEAPSTKNTAANTQQGKSVNTFPTKEELMSGQDEIIFETFYHKSGKEIQCMYIGNTRYYLDHWGSKEWQPFPRRWYNEGLLITNTVVKDDNQAQQQQQRQDTSGASGSSGAAQQQTRQRQQGDDREGLLHHPKRGKIPTYIYQRKHNVHFFFDKDAGQWLRMPIGWELHHEMVSKLVDQVEEMIPGWNDRHDILALLRQCNYDPDECINTYFHLEGDPWLKAPRTSKEAKATEEKDVRIAELEARVKQLEEELAREKQGRAEAEKVVKNQEEQITNMEVETKQAEAQLSALTQSRPKSAARPKTPQVVAVTQNIKPEDIDELNETAKELRKSQSKLKQEVQRYFDNLKDMIGTAVKSAKDLKKSGSGQLEEMEEVRALYRREAMQRKLLYNQLQELRGNIRVFCRARKDDRCENYLKFPTESEVVCVHPQQGKKMFSFDRVFSPTSTQEQIFADTKPIVTSCVDGYNVCLMAYGQTGSGKTFTMIGPEENPGINIRAIKELFQVCKDRKETQTYTLKVALIEIYNETIQDLLTNDARVLDLKTAGNKVNLAGLTEVEIKEVADIKNVMKMGDKNRSVASTKMNSTSSRSHLLLMLSVEGHDKVTGSVSKGTLTLVDLAGSERISKTEAEGQRLVEAAAINKSLSALGQVFTSLRTSQLHTPYRNSKLTQILQPSLGGDAKACLFVNISPDINNYSETVSTLTFGSNAKQVALGQAKQNIKKAS